MSLTCDIIQTVPHKTGQLGRRFHERTLWFRLVFRLLTEDVENESLANQYIFVRVFHIQVHLTQNGNLIVSVAL